MTDKAKIAEAMARYERLLDDASLLTRDDVRAMDTLALAYFSEHVNDDKPPTREMFERLCVDEDCESLFWSTDEHAPVLFLYDDEVRLDTIAKLRAACLLLGIETEGILDTKRDNT